MATKRKRGSNYTAQEIDKLLELVSQYRSIVNDKRTTAIVSAQKSEAWEKICASYNAVATSGVRTVEQLKVFYDNKKQKARNARAQNNSQSNKTGDCNCRPTANDSVQKILALIKDEGTQLPNSSDSDVAYSEGSIEELPIEVLVDECITSEPPKTEENFKEYIEELPIEVLVDECKTSEPPKTEENFKVKTQRKKCKRINYYKQLYFKMKCQNAFLEKKRINQDIRLRQQEHDMFIQEHKLKLEVMKTEHDYRMTTMTNNKVL